MMCRCVIRRRLCSAELALDTQWRMSTHLQVKFLTRTVYTEFHAQLSDDTLSHVEAELAMAVKTGRAYTRSKSFEDFALLKLFRNSFSGDITEGADRLAAAGAGAGAQTVAAQQKRKAVDGRTHRRSKRARRGKLTGGMRVEDT